MNQKTHGRAYNRRMLFGEGYAFLVFCRPPKNEQTGPFVFAQTITSPSKWPATYRSQSVFVLVPHGNKQIPRAKVTRVRLREQAERLRRKRDMSARTLQGWRRSYCARQKLENMKRLLRLEKARRHAAATRIQTSARASRCR